MGVQERRAREKQELRQEIVDAARDLFVREGFDNVSMRKIAEKIEYSPTTIYLYFLDKADLLDCIVEETFQRLEARMAGIHESIPDPRQRLIEGLRAYIDFGIEHPSDYRVAFLVERKGNADSYPRCGTMGQKLLEHVRQSVADCIRAGVFPVQDIEVASQVLWGGRARYDVPPHSPSRLRLGPPPGSDRTSDSNRHRRTSVLYPGGRLRLSVRDENHHRTVPDQER